jgi:hypothetical protein
MNFSAEQAFMATMLETGWMVTEARQTSKSDDGPAPWLYAATNRPSSRLLQSCEAFCRKWHFLRPEIGDKTEPYR